MGGKTSTSSGSYGGDDRGRDRNDRSIEAEITGGTKKVKEEIKKSGTDMYVVNTYAFKDGKKNEMYGGQASTAAKKRMAEAGLGTYNENNDSFQNVVGNQIISSTGMMGTSMGSGENTIMGQIPISEKMFESQKRIQMIATGAMAAVGVPLMGAAFMDYNRKRYSDYVTSFNSALGSTSSSTSYAAKSNTDISDARIQDTKAQAESNESSKEAAQQALLRKQAIARNQAALKGKRTFFSGSKKLIKGEMQ